MSSDAAALLNALAGPDAPLEAPLDGSFPGVDRLAISDVMRPVNWEEGLDDGTFDALFGPTIVRYYERLAKRE